MERKDLIELTIKVYKITLFFPKKDPLRYKIRDVANRILENFIALKNSNKEDFFIIAETKKDIDVLDSYLEISKWQNWVSYFDILNLKNEYVKIKNSFSEIDIVKNSKEIKIPIEQSFHQEPKEDLKKKKLNIRQEKILDILKTKEMIQVWEVNRILPDVSKRTLRRDFEQLLKEGSVERIGEKNQTYYKLMGHQ